MLVSREAASLPAGALIGTSSLRRRAQLLAGFPGSRGRRSARQRRDSPAQARGRRGRRGRARRPPDCHRLGLEPEHARPLPLAMMVPAPGQGCLAVQTRDDDDDTMAAVAPLDHAPSHRALDAERSLMWRLGGGCALPLGAHAVVGVEAVSLTAIVATPDGTTVLRVETEGGTPEDAARPPPRADRPRGGAHPRRGRARVEPCEPASASRRSNRLLVTRPADQSASLGDGPRAPRCPHDRRARDRDRAGAISSADQGAPRSRSGRLRVAHRHQPGHRRHARDPSSADHGRWAPRRSLRSATAPRRRSVGGRDRDPDLVPATFTTIGLARAFPRGSGRVLCARADIAPEGLEDALAAKGWSPTRVDAYRTRMPSARCRRRPDRRCARATSTR